VRAWDSAQNPQPQAASSTENALARRTGLDLTPSTAGFARLRASVALRRAKAKLCLRLRLPLWSPRLQRRRPRCDLAPRRRPSSAACGSKPDYRPKGKSEWRPRTLLRSASAYVKNGCSHSLRRRRLARGKRRDAIPLRRRPTFTRSCSARPRYRLRPNRAGTSPCSRTVGRLHRRYGRDSWFGRPCGEVGEQIRCLFNERHRLVFSLGSRRLTRLLSVGGQ
jgi:hypothetical protein